MPNVFTASNGVVVERTPDGYKSGDQTYSDPNHTASAADWRDSAGGIGEHGHCPWCDLGNRERIAIAEYLEAHTDQNGADQ